MKKDSHEKKKFYSPYSHLYMTIFNKVNSTLYSSYSGMSIKKITGKVGILELNDVWVLFNKQGFYIDHDSDIQALAKRRMLDITPSTFI